MPDKKEYLEKLQNIITEEQEPFHVKFTINFNENLINDKDAKYFAFYHDKWGTVDAEPLLDINGNEVKGDVDGQSSVSYEIVPPANVVVAAMGLETAQYTNLYTPIDKDTTVHMIAAKETLYADPMDPPSSLDKIEKKLEELDEKIIDIFGNIW